MYLENSLKEIKEKYNEAYAKRIVCDNIDTYTGPGWYYCERLNQYLSIESNFVLAKHQYSKVIFKNKEDAKKFQKYKKEMYRLINIYVQKRVDDALSELQGIHISNKILEDWRKEFWYQED